MDQGNFRYDAAIKAAVTSSPGIPCRYKKPNYRHRLNLAHVQKGFFGKFLHEAEQTVTSHLSHI